MNEKWSSFQGTYNLACKITSIIRIQKNVPWFRNIQKCPLRLRDLVLLNNKNPMLFGE